MIYLFVPTLAPVFVWGIFRYCNDGITFFVKMFGIDVLNRVGGVVENHSGGLFFYFRIGYYLGFIGVSLISLTMVLTIILLFRKVVRTNEMDIPFVVIFSLTFAIPFTLFTMVPTKLTHYVFPCIIGIAFVFSYACQFVIPFLWTRICKKLFISAFTIITIAIVFVDPYITNTVFYKPTTHTESIFKQIPELDEKNYYSISVDGKKNTVQQSWLLEGNFLGYAHKHGNYTDYKNSEQTALILLKYASPEELTDFLSFNHELHVLIEYEEYALLSIWNHLSN